MKILIILIMIVGMLYSASKEQTNDLNKYKIDDVISKVKNLEHDNKSLIQSNIELKAEVKNIKIINEKKTEVYKDLINNNNSLYANQLNTFQLILLVVGLIFSFITFIGLRAIKSQIDNKVKELILDKSNKLLDTVTEKIKLLDIKINEVDERLKLTMEKDSSKQSENDKKIVDMVTKNLDTKENKSSDEWFFLGLEYQQKNKLDEAIKAYKESILLNPNNGNAFNNLAIALSNLAKIKNDEELYKESIEKYKKAIELNPNNGNAFNNWAAVLGYLAKIKNDEELYKESIEKCKKAIELNPNDGNAFNNWSVALTGLARIKNDEELYKESIEKCKKAIELNPNDVNVFSNWGVALIGLAGIKNDEELYKESIEKYKKAIELNHNNDSAFNGIGTALSKLAKIEKDKDKKEKLLQECFINYEKAFNLNKQFYNMSCIYGIKNNKEKALEYLENTLKNNQVPIEHIEKDDDWDNYKEDKDFKDLLDKYRK